MPVVALTIECVEPARPFRWPSGKRVLLVGFERQSGEALTTRQAARPCASDRFARVGGWFVMPAASAAPSSRFLTEVGRRRRRTFALVACLVAMRARGHDVFGRLLLSSEHVFRCSAVLFKQRQNRWCCRLQDSGSSLPAKRVAGLYQVAPHSTWASAQR